jgi:hypothetical protein
VWVCVFVYVWVCVCVCARTRHNISIATNTLGLFVEANSSTRLTTFQKNKSQNVTIDSSKWHLIQTPEADGKCFMFRASHACPTHAWFVCSPYTSVSTSCELHLDLKALRFPVHILSKCIENSYLKWFLEINLHVQWNLFHLNTERNQMQHTWQHRTHKYGVLRLLAAT